MIINVLANGDIKNIVPENIYQGSNKANTIVLLAPFSASVTPTISFELPQTHEIKGGANGYLFNEPTEVSNTVNMWTLQVDEVLTQYYGDVKYQIKFVNTDNEVVAVARGKFKVNEGVDFELPATPSQDVYELLLQNISNIRADFLNGWIEAHGIREYNSDFAYSLGSYVFGVVDNKTMFFRSLIENNKGNALTNTSAWKSIIIGINGVKVNGVEQPTDIDGNVKLTVPTKLSELTVDVGIPSKLSELTDDIGVALLDGGDDYTKPQLYSGYHHFANVVKFGGTESSGKHPTLQIGIPVIVTEGGDRVYYNSIGYRLETDTQTTIRVPRKNGVFALTQDINDALKNHYTKEEVDNLMSSLPKFNIAVVDVLPTTNISATTIYLVRSNEPSPNLYEEYIYINGQWEFLGSQSLELTADTIANIIEDSESIVAMVDGDKLKFELDGEITSQISKSLVVPMVAPSSTELVAIDDGNSQTMVSIGQGLRLQNGVLSATGGGGTGSSVNVVDSLTSQSSTDALSAKQGNVLYNMLVDAGNDINQSELNAQKHILIGGNGVLNGNVYSFTIENPSDYIDYRTNLTKFLVDLSLPITGALDTTKEVAITFGDTTYYVFNILKGMEHSTIGDLHQVDKYNNETGYRFIAEMTFFENEDTVGFAIIPTISMSDILALDSDQMDNYVADGGLTQGQLAVCSKVITNGYEVGALYRFDIVYPNTYSWEQIGYSKSGIDNAIKTAIQDTWEASY